MQALEAGQAGRDVLNARVESLLLVQGIIDKRKGMPRRAVHKFSKEYQDALKPKTDEVTP